MKCPNCNEEAGLLLGDAEVASLKLEGTKATVEVAQRQYCDQCSEVVVEDRFRGGVEVPEAAAHQGAGHEAHLHGVGLEAVEGEPEFEVRFNLVCSCGKTTPHRAKGVLVVEPSAPWQDPS